MGACPGGAFSNTIKKSKCQIIIVELLGVAGLFRVFDFRINSGCSDVVSLNRSKNSPERRNVYIPKDALRQILVPSV